MPYATSLLLDSVWHLPHTPLVTNRIYVYIFLRSFCEIFPHVCIISFINYYWRTLLFQVGSLLGFKKTAPSELLGYTQAPFQVYSIFNLF